MSKKRKLVWTAKAESSLEYIYEYIKEDSPQNARKVKNEIQKTARKLLKNPEIYQVDEYYPNNPDDIRRYFNWSYRTVYEVRDEAIVILNIYHTSLDPSKMKVP